MNMGFNKGRKTFATHIPKEPQLTIPQKTVPTAAGAMAGTVHFVEQEKTTSLHTAIG
jgi:hypothetical protein